MLAVTPYGGCPWGSAKATDYEDLVVDNTKAWTLTKLVTAHVGVRIRNEGATVRLRDDGGTPVTGGGSGEIWFDAEFNTFNNIQAAALQVIADGATPSTLRVHYFKGG